MSGVESAGGAQSACAPRSLAPGAALDAPGGRFGQAGVDRVPRAHLAEAEGRVGRGRDDGRDARVVADDHRVLRAGDGDRVVAGGGEARVVDVGTVHEAREQLADGRRERPGVVGSPLGRGRARVHQQHRGRHGRRLGLVDHLARRAEHGVAVVGLLLHAAVVGLLAAVVRDRDTAALLRGRLAAVERAVVLERHGHADADALGRRDLALALDQHRAALVGRREREPGSEHARHHRNCHELLVHPKSPVFCGS